MSLQPAQQDRIAAIAQRHADAFAKYKEQGVTWSSVTPEQIALEERQVAASILQQNLVAKKAALLPSPDPRYRPVTSKRGARCSINFRRARASPSQCQGCKASAKNDFQL